MSGPNLKPETITVNVTAGLGNQLFQYAMGRALSLRTGLPLQLDIRHFRKKRARDYGLDQFTIRVKIGTRQTLPRQRPAVVPRWLWGRFADTRNVFRESGHGYDPRLEAVAGNAYLRGYWQSEKYFQDYASVIRDDLSWVQEPNGLNRAVLDAIRETPSIAIHVRRGDYVKNPKYNAFHGTCLPRYYAASVERIRSTTGLEPVAFIFSDDAAWAAENIRLPCPVRIVNHNDGRAAAEDLRLIAACDHQVISNSTFSWWGAWLNRNPHKQVCAPSRWFRDPNVTNPDIIPSSWTVIDTELVSGTGP